MKFFLIFLCLLTSCGGGGENSVKVVLKFPNILARNTIRFYRFIGRSQSLKIHVKALGGTEKEYKFEPAQYEKLVIKDVVLPKGEETVTLSAEFWDRLPDGSMRPFPVLSGSQKITGKEISKNKSEIEIAMLLHVSVTEFDK